MTKKENIKKFKIKKVAVVIFVILLLSQIVLFGLNSVFNIKGKLLSVKHISDLSSLKKIWIGNILIIEGRTVVSCHEPLDQIKIGTNNIVIDSSITEQVDCWGYKDYSARNIIVYNNIFSALEAYIFNDAISIDFGNVVIL